MMSKTDPLRHLARQGQGSRQAAAWWPMLEVRKATVPESAPTWEKVDRRFPSLRRGRRGDQEFVQDRPQHNGTLGFPSHTKEKARERAKVKEKEEKATKEKERDTCLDLVSIQLEDRHPGHMPYLDENSYPSELVPLWATVRNVSNEDEQGWKTVKGRKETNAPIETQIMVKEVNSGGGTRFGALEVTMNSEEDFLVLMADVQNGAAKQNNYEEDAQERFSS